MAVAQLQIGPCTRYKTVRRGRRSKTFDYPCLSVRIENGRVEKKNKTPFCSSEPPRRNTATRWIIWCGGGRCTVIRRRVPCRHCALGTRPPGGRNSAICSRPPPKTTRVTACWTPPSPQSYSSPPGITFSLPLRSDRRAERYSAERRPPCSFLSLSVRIPIAALVDSVRANSAVCGAALSITVENRPECSCKSSAPSSSSSFLRLSSAHNRPVSSSGRRRR